MNRRTVGFTDGQDAVIEAIQAATARSQSVPYIKSQSELFRYTLDLGIERLIEDADPKIDIDDVSASDVSEASLGKLLPKEAVVEHQRNKLKSGARHEFLSIDVAGRFARKADELFEGDYHKPHPDGVESIADSFVDEIDMYADHGFLSERDAEQQREAIRDRMSTYRDEYEAAQSAPNMRDVPPEVELGQAVARLRENGDEFLAELAEKAEMRLTSPDDVVRCMSNTYGVSETVVDALLNEITPDGMPGRQALREQHADALPTVASDPAVDGDSTPQGAISND